MGMDYLDFKSMLEPFGITDKNFIAPLYSQLVSADGFGGDGLEFAAAVIKGIAPNDPLEAMLAGQMAVVHWAAMKYMRQVAEEKGTAYQELAVSAATKLLRTFSAQLDALKRYRTGGEQTLTVKHVAVDERGQATVVRQVTQTKSPRKAALKKSDEKPALTDSRQAPMPDLQSEKEAWLEYVRKTESLANTGPMLASPRCGAWTRSGKPCMSPAVRGKRRCRMHGGAPGWGAPRGNKNALKHGRYTREALAEYRRVRDLIRLSRELIQKIK